MREIDWLGDQSRSVLLTIADDTDGRQIRRVHFISGDPLAGLALPILAVRRDDAEEVQKCPEGLAIGCGQQLNEMLKSFLLQPPVSDLWKNIGMTRLSWPYERAKDWIRKLKVDSQLKLQRGRGRLRKRLNAQANSVPIMRVVKIALSLDYERKPRKREIMVLSVLDLASVRNWSLLTLSVHEGLIQIPAEQRIRQIAEVLLQKGGYVMGTLVGTYFSFTSAIEVLP